MKIEDDTTNVNSPNLILNNFWKNSERFADLMVALKCYQTLNMPTLSYPKNNL